MKPLLVFDYDGTLHDTLRVYEPAMRMAFRWLEEAGYAQTGPVSRERIASWLGMNPLEMWDSFLPQLPEEARTQAIAMVGEEMLRRVRAGQGCWYPQVEQVLEELKRLGFPMVILSNCSRANAAAHWQEFSLGRWFQRFYDCESFGFQPKTDIILQIQRDDPGDCVVIGDRKSDLDCARAAGAAFIGCGYGFGAEGELQGADWLVSSPEELLPILAGLE